MNIGIDARFYGPEAKGLGRYTQELIKHLAGLDRDNQYFVFLRQKDFDKAEFEAPNLYKVLADYKPYSLKEQFLLPWKIKSENIDLMHFTHFNAPIFYRGRFVVTIHDLILKKFPTKRAGLLNRLRYAVKDFFYDFCLRATAGKALKIIAVSQYTKKDLIKTLGLDSEKIEVIYEGISLIKRGKNKPLDQERVLAKYGVKSPFLLYVGNAYPHKNLEFLLKAFERLIKKIKGKDLQLVLVGGTDDFYQLLKGRFHQACCAAPKQKKKYCLSVIFTGFVSDEELQALYQSAFCYVFPSLYEGFGLPGLEAMAYDLPVVAAKASCLPEIFGSAALYFNPRDERDFANKMSQFAEDQFLRQKLTSLGREQAGKFSWEKTAQQTLGVYKKLKTF